MLTQYIDSAMHRARYEALAEGGFYGEIEGFAGVYANSNTLESTRDELIEVLEEWLFLRIARNLPVPVLDGCELRLQAVE